MRSILTRALSACAAFAIAATAGLACSGPTHAPRPLYEEDDASVALPGDAEGDGATSFDVAFDASINCALGKDGGVCACKELGSHPPTLYIVLDRSGSMMEVIAPSTLSKWDQTVRALLDAKTGVLRALGAHLAVGMTIFPGPSADGCEPGAEIFETRTGGPAAYDDLAKKLAPLAPKGATPTSATLRALLPRLASLPRPIYVMLATDGAPNCGTTPCSIDQCQYNIENLPLGGGRFCDSSINCCDPSKIKGGDGWRACLDAEPTRKAIADLVTAGISVFVLGEPGSEPYAAALDSFAIAGGTAQSSGKTRYYAVTDPASLQAALTTIGGKVVDSCTVILDAPPDDPGVTNVLLDGELVPQDPIDGWTWQDPTHLVVHGAACAKITAGEVSRVQVAVGCKTVER